MISLIKNQLQRNWEVTDKYTEHSYVEELYSSLFLEYRDRPINLLEIGIRTGCSVALWKEYFTHPSTRIFGVDIENQFFKQEYHKAGIEYIWENAYTEVLGKRLPEFHIIIDDGPHTLESQVSCIKIYGPKLTADGVMLIEDIETMDAMSTLRTYAEEKGFVATVFDYRAIKSRPDDLLLMVRKRESA